MIASIIYDGRFDYNGRGHFKSVDSIYRFDHRLVNPNMKNQSRYLIYRNETGHLYVRYYGARKNIDFVPNFVCKYIQRYISYDLYNPLQWLEKHLTMAGIFDRCHICKFYYYIDAGDFYVCLKRKMVVTTFGDYGTCVYRYGCDGEFIPNDERQTKVNNILM